MTVIQRFRHLRVLDPVAVDGTDRYRPADRAALVKKALAVVYGESSPTDPTNALAALHADLVATIALLELDTSVVSRRSNQLRSDYASYALSQPPDDIVGE